MKKIGIISTLFFFMVISVSVKAQSYKMGVGIRISNNAPVINNSISFKYFFSQQTAVEALLSFGDPVGLGVLLEKHKPLASSDLNWFYGGGLYFGFSGTRNVGGQGVLGLDFKFPAVPINLSLDWKPELNFTKEFSFEPAAVGLSARFTLK
jgi:hypothetical protein